jgi:hypothetical protein
MDRDKQVEMMVSDAITEKPIGFTVGDRTFSIKPPSIGKLQVLSRYYLLLEMDDKAMDENPMNEAMRVCEEKADTVCSLMAAATFDNKEELLDEDKVKELADFFKWNTTPDSFATVLLALLTQVHYENFIGSIRLTETLRLNKPKGSERADRVE